MKEAGWLVCLVLAGAGACFGQGASFTALPADPTAQTAEGKIVQEMFGKKIDTAKARLKDDDVLAVANQLLAAANDGSISGKLKLALAMTGLRVSVVVGSEESGRVARKALEVIQSTSPMGAVDRAFYLKEISLRRLAKARLEHLSNDDLQAVAKTAMEASMSYADVAMNDDEVSADVVSVMRQMRTWMNLYKLKEYSQSLDDLDKEYKAVMVKRVRLKEALARLDTAKRAKDPEGVKAASKVLAAVYLDSGGDLRSAAKYYRGADDPRGKVVVAAVDVLDHPKPLDTRKALETIDGLVHLIDSLTDVAKINASRTALELGGLYMASDPPESAVAKVKLAMMQWQSITGTSQNDKLKKELAEAYGPIQGKLEALGSGRVKLTYDFSSRTQINDWDPLDGTWDVGAGMLGCKTSNSSKPGSIEFRLPFRQDRPFKISFTGVARRELTVKVFVTPWKSGRGHDRTLIFKMLEDGAYCYSFEPDWTDSKTHLLSEKPCKIELSSEGDGNIAWSINGTEAHVFTPGENNVKGFKGSFKFALQTRGADRTPTVFDSVVTEGVILPSADYVPDDYQKADKKGDQGKTDAGGGADK
jgi:hypothetical protein